MERFEAAISNPLLAGEAVHALFLGQEDEEAELGALIIAAGMTAWLRPADR